MTVERNISKEDLNDKEKSFARRIRWFSTLNFISSFPTFLPPIKLTEETFIRFGFSYLPICSGDLFEQSIYFKNHKSYNGLFFKQYVAKNIIGFGIGLKLFDQKISKRLSVNTQVDYWLQPQNQLFLASSLESGFSVEQQYSFNFNKFGLFSSISFKTQGFSDKSLKLDQDLNLHFGFKAILH